MNKLVLSLAASILVGATVPATPRVEAGDTDWSQFPALKKKTARTDYGPLVDWTSEILGSGNCKVKGLRRDRFDIDVPYAALVQPDGTVTRVLVARMGCPELETMVGSAIVAMVKRGEVKPTGLQEAAWFGDRVSFAREP